MTQNIEQAFNAMEWHDSTLLRLTVDRRSPGQHDEVLLVLEWPDARKQEVRFVDCYAFDVQMNFGVTAPESIRAAQCVDNSATLEAIRKRWEGLGVALADLLCFEITTNSTASAFRIYAKRFEVADTQADP